MHESIGSDPFRARKDAINHKLGLYPGPGGVVYRGDKLWARNISLATGPMFTYEEIVRHAEVGPSPSLPEGAVRCTDDEVVCVLQEGHLEALERFGMGEFITRVPTTLSGYTVRSLQDVAEYFGIDPEAGSYPVVEGHEWYLGHYCGITEGQAALVFEPRIFTAQIGVSPFPQLYTLGDPDIGIVREIAQAFAAYESGSTFR